MPLSRRALLGAAGVALVTAGCAGPAPRLPGPPPASAGRPATAAPPAPQPDSAEALLGWIRDHPARASLLVDDGRGGALDRLADTPRPVASAAKVVHLAAYARAVAAGRLDPAATVPVAEWERWYLPYTDGGAHPRALDRLGLTPAGVASWDRVVDAMVVDSDNAAPDLLRAELGDAALVEAAAAAGWAPLDLPSYLGETLLVTVPDRAGEPRRAVAVALASEFADGGPIREVALEQTARALADDDAVLRWAAGTPGATARQLAGLHLAAATDRFGSPAVAGIMREHLERPLAGRLPPGALGAGTKGGSLPGVLSEALTLRRGDGTVGVAVISLDGLARDEYDTLAGGALGTLAGRLLTEPLLLAHAARTLP
ncbi:MAG: serine hydrolase [Pseudonocardia sp.]